MVTDAPPARPYPHQQGFTLMELMIALAIAAILAVIALPSYQQIIAKGNRNIARSALLDLGASQEKFRIKNRRFATHFGELGALPTASTATTLYLDRDGGRTATNNADTVFSVSFEDNGAVCGAATPQALLATAVRTQATRDSRCRTFLLCYTGKKLATNGSGASSSQTYQECWS